MLALAVFYAAAAASLLLLRRFDPPLTAVQVQRIFESLADGQPLRWQRQVVPLERISPHLQHAVLAAEDTRFFRHGGVDWEEVRNAIRDNRKRGRRWRGGSTITQQLVKNLFLTTRRSFVRKAFEVPLALLADAILPKRRILELYLNAVEWGPGIYGAEAAAQHHFGVSATRLTREQAARLAACLPAPQTRRPQKMNRYSAVILEHMRQLGW